MDNLLYKLGKIPGALMILPLFLGALINTFAPAILNIGSFTTALFKNGVPVLIGLFFYPRHSNMRGISYHLCFCLPPPVTI